MNTALKPPTTIQLGVFFLDEVEPDWWRPDRKRPINLDTLDMGHNDLCLLGQLFGNYYDALEQHNIDDWIAGNYGMHAFMGTPEEIEELNCDWRNYILARRAEAPTLVPDMPLDGYPGPGLGPQIRPLSEAPSIFAVVAETFGFTNRNSRANA